MTGCQRAWHRGVHTHFIPLMVLLPWLSSMNSCGGHSVCYAMASMGWDIYPSTKCMWYCRHPLPLHVTWSLNLSSVDALVDIHGRSHNFPLIHPMGSLPGLMLGDHQTTIFLWHSLTVTPPGSRLYWGGAGTSVPCFMDIHTQRNTSFWCDEESQLQCRTHDCPHWSVTSYEGISVMIWCTTS